MNTSYTTAYLSKLLVNANLLTMEQIQLVRVNENKVRSRILKEQLSGANRREHYEVSPAEVLADFEFVTPNNIRLDENTIMRTIAQAAKIPFEKPDPLKLNSDVIAATMTRPFARRHTCVPLRKEDGKVVVAVDNPFDQQFLQDLHNVISGEVSIVVSPKTDIRQIITEVYGFRGSIAKAEADQHDRKNLGNLEQLVRLRQDRELEATDQPVINAVEYLLKYAFEQRASDIHIEPKREETHVRLRIDGVLHTIYTFPKVVHPPFISRLKMLARMDISEKRRPQDGRIKTQHDNIEIELRVSSLPVAFGEKIVIRVFDPGQLIQSLDTIGFYGDILKDWRRFMGQPTGLVLVTGPTGSGKTTTLYSTLKELARPDVNITTVEDPIEMVYEEFNQVLVQKRVDVTFSNALKTILRQDPDIVMIGEIRDAETAKMATQAALTGHLVFSTLHTNDTASTISRLLDLGVEPFLLSSTLLGIMAQRLVRKICPHCTQDTELTQEQVRLLNIKLPPRSGQSLPVKYGAGCIQCRNTGYYSRDGVFELMEVDDTIRALINERASAPKIRRAARSNGMMSLRECAIKKLAQGVTTFEEVLAVSSDD